MSKKGFGTYTRTFRAHSDEDQDRGGWRKFCSNLEAPRVPTDAIEYKVEHKPMRMLKATNSWELMTRPPQMAAGTVPEVMHAVTHAERISIMFLQFWVNIDDRALSIKLYGKIRL